MAGQFKSFEELLKFKEEQDKLNKENTDNTAPVGESTVENNMNKIVESQGLKDEEAKKNLYNQIKLLKLKEMKGDY